MDRLRRSIVGRDAGWRLLSAAASLLTVVWLGSAVWFGYWTWIEGEPWHPSPVLAAVVCVVVGANLVVSVLEWFWSRKSKMCKQTRTAPADWTEHKRREGIIVTGGKQPPNPPGPPTSQPRPPAPPNPSHPTNGWGS